MIGSQHRALRQQGMVLVSSLLLLLVVTILAVSMFRSFGLDEKIAGNTRDKQLATQAAQSAEQYAENWLQQNISLSAAANSGFANPITTVTCAAPVINYTVGQVCANPLVNPGTLPWAAGVRYPPPTLSVTGSQTMISPPVFYIYAVQTAAPPYIYQIDAVGYGSSPNTVALVEVLYTVWNTNGYGG